MGWSGACTNVSGTCTVEASPNQNRNATAIFDLDPGASATTCSRSGTTLNVTTGIGGSASIKRSLSNISVSGTSLSPNTCGGATVNNVNLVSVTGASGNESLTLDLSGGQFGPGATGEGTGTSEIEFDVDLGSGDDSLSVIGAGAADKLTIGSAGFKLNTDGDSDVTLDGAEDFTFSGGAGADVLTAAGGAGVGSPLATAVTFSGGTGNDKLTGGNGADVLNGGDNNDTVKGGAGGDTMDGGLGLDTLLYSGSPAGLTVNLGNASTSPQTASGGHGTGDVLAAFEHVTGSTFADNLTGSSVVNVLKGTGGNDTLSGAAGNDNLVGAAGVDRFDGGAGTDNCDRAAGETAVSCET